MDEKELKTRFGGVDKILDKCSQEGLKARQSDDNTACVDLHGAGAGSIFVYFTDDSHNEAEASITVEFSLDADDSEKEGLEKIRRALLKHGFGLRGGIYSDIYDRLDKKTQEVIINFIEGLTPPTSVGNIELQDDEGKVVSFSQTFIKRYDLKTLIEEFKRMEKMIKE